MVGITFASQSEEMAQFLSSMLGHTEVRRVWSNEWQDASEAVVELCAHDPELLLLGEDVHINAVRALVAEGDRHFPGTTIVVLVREEEVHLAMDLLRLGARDVVSTNQDEGSFRENIEQILDIARIRRNHVPTANTSKRNRVITVLSPKGGTGKTTLSVNLAVGLAVQNPNQVLLVDFDTHFGDAASALGLQPEHSLYHAIASTAMKRSALKAFLTPHSSGLSLLAAPDDLSLADSIDNDSLKTTMMALVDEFPYVIFDTAAGIDTACLAAMELSTDFLFVATTDVPAIRAVRRQVEALDRIGYTNQRRTFILNRANAKVGLSVSDVESAVGMAASFRIPSSRVIPVSINQGTPAVLESKGNVARTFEEIARFFEPGEKPGDGDRRSRRGDR